VSEILHWVEELDVDMVVFDDELMPRHQRELESVFGDDVRVIDRTALILDIFAQHAHTKEGALQVSLAQYEYRLPRLTRQWTHLVRQAGGGAVRGGVGGVGLRGPGETQLETDRRDIRRRISRLRREIEALRAHRERHRVQRRRHAIPMVALVGYTNAGKSTLLNQLSGASVYVADQLFATLDPTVRRTDLPGGQAILVADTVGFIQKLPHTLVAAFRATLEEIAEAELLVHVVDASHRNAIQQVEVVEETLEVDLGIGDIERVMAINKVDLIDSAEDHKLLNLMHDRYPEAICISALSGLGIEQILEKMKELLDSKLVRVVVRIPYTEGALIAHFYDVATVEAEAHDGYCVELIGTLNSRSVARYQDYVV
jgi:GTP-binding protein HflX